VRPVLHLDEKRFALRADPLGKKLTLTPLLGEGALAVRFQEPKLAGHVTDWTVTVESKDGTVFTLRSDEAKTQAPADSYRLHSADIKLKDQRDRLWRFIFLDQTVDQTSRWHRLDKNGQLNLDPLTGFDVAVKVSTTKNEAESYLQLQPEICTRDGLTLYRCSQCLDTNVVDSQAQLSVRSKGTSVGTAHCGFT